MRKIKWIMGAVVVLLAGLVRADVVYFNGADAGNNNFSDADNWVGGSVPNTSAIIYIGGNASPSTDPAIIDAAFTVELGTANINSGSGGTYGFGPSYAEIVSGGTLKATTVNVGSSANKAYDGNLVLRSGGTILNRYTLSGGLHIGGDDDGEIGLMTVESGASLTHTLLNLNSYGTLTFELGANSVTTFESSKNTAGDANTLDGLLQVDLGALTTVGSYTLVDSSSANLLIAGGLLTDLTAAGGSITNVSQSTRFNVLNEGNIEWNLATADGGQDLVLNVTAIPEPATVGLFAAAAAGLLVLRRRMSL